MLRKISYNNSLIEYELTYKRVKNINLRIKGNGRIMVSCKKGISPSRIDEFVLSNAEKILKFQEKVSCIQDSMQISCDLRDGEAFYILGERKTIKSLESNNCRAYFDDDFLFIEAPRNSELQKKKDAVVKLLDSICRDEVEKELGRYAFFLEELDLKYHSVVFRKMRSRWGSCSPSNGKIVFNKLLACTPTECIEYVVLHELVHLLHPNHSNDFYNCVKHYIPNYKKCKEILSRYSLSLLNF